MPNGTSPEPAMHESTTAIARPESREHEADLWQWLDRLATESDRVRRDEARFDEFDTFLDVFYGKHWPATLPSFRPPVVVNELRTLILSEASDLTEAQLRVFITKDKTHAERDTAVERAFRAIWVREQVDQKLMYACVWALICGTGFLEVVWDPDAADGLGDVVVNVVDPRNVLPDPDALDDETWQYVIKEQVLDIVEIRRLFPHSGWRVRPEDAYSVKDHTRSAPTGVTSAAYVGPLTPGESFLHGAVSGYKKARARLLDCYINDPTVEDTLEVVRDAAGRPERDANGEERIERVVRAKYPRGRRIVGANGVILFDGDNPNPGKDFSLLRVVLEPPLGRFWSTGFVQQTAELQLAADKLFSGIVENAIRLNNGLVISTTNTGLDWETFASIPAQIVRINPGSEFKIQYPPPMPPDMIQAPWRMLDMQRRILGFQDARAGMPGRGNVSPDLAETEISQAQATTRLRARLLGATVRRLAKMIFARMAYGYLTRRVIPAVEGEAYKPVQWEPLANPDQYAIYVDPASFQVMSRSALRRLSLALYKLRAVDRRALLETLAWPDWEATAERLDRAEQLAAMAKLTAKKGRAR